MNFIYKNKFFENKRKKKFRNSRKHKCDNKKIKFILVLIISNIFIFSFFGVKGFNNKIEINKINDNNWFKKNKTEFLKNYISIFNGYSNRIIERDINYIKQYLDLKILVKDGNMTLNLETKEKLKNELFKITKKNFSLLKNIYILKTINFGNQMIAFNNLIYYCENLGIKNIFLNNEIDWYIKNDVINEKIKISVISDKKINCNNNDTFCSDMVVFFFPIFIKSERRSLLLKKEIKQNLPQIITNKNDLYIYIRSGDSFQPGGNHYPPAPFCFYNKIITRFNYNNIYIISQDDKSPIIGKLLSNFPKIKHSLNSKEIDIAILINAYNLVNAVSSFTQATISFNDNLINLFEYELYQLGTAIIHFHYDIDKLNRKFNIYRMKSSENYYLKMFQWENNEEQRKLLFEENCKYDFKKTIYSKTIFD